MADATQITITQIATTTIAESPYVIALGEDGGVYALNLTNATNKQLNSQWIQLPPIYIPNGFTYPLVRSSGGDILPNVTPLIYLPTPTT